MSIKVLLLGCGLIGREIARDLTRNGEFLVIALDKESSNLNELSGIAGISPHLVNINDREPFANLALDCDIVVNALPSFVGFSALQSVIELGRDIVDISFFGEDPFSLDALAKEREVTAIVDCGVAPGLSHILVGKACSQLEVVKKIRIYVGGLPRTPEPPWYYRAVFSPIDVIEEYLRPARMILNGHAISVDPLDEVERIEIDGIGNLEAFTSDGLRTLLTTIKAEEMLEKTLRYPGHLSMMRALRDAGLFGHEPPLVNGKEVPPIDVLAQLVFPKWKLQEGEEDLTFLRVIVDGIQRGKSKLFTFELLDRYDTENNVTSMARTTAYTATSAVRLITNGIYSESGVCPPEYLGMHPPSCEAILSFLRERNVLIRECVE